MIDRVQIRDLFKGVGSLAKSGFDISSGLLTVGGEVWSGIRSAAEESRLRFRSAGGARYNYENIVGLKSETLFGTAVTKGGYDADGIWRAPLDRNFRITSQHTFKKQVGPASYGWNQQFKSFLGRRGSEHIGNLFSGTYVNKMGVAASGARGGALYKLAGNMFGKGFPLTAAFALSQEGNPLGNLVEATAYAGAWTTGANIGAAIGSSILPIGGTVAGYVLGGLSASIGLAAGVETTKTVARIGVASRNMRYGPSYVDTEAAYTMRQRSINIMRESAQNSRMILGNEARYAHM